ncbi:MAG: hypothetical protein GYB67_16710 [Chloroflexi bacterium]|nr:hypothetical protein [Chloroflexota bacterium]
MDDLDALRQFADADDDEPEIDIAPTRTEARRFLGMTAVERMLLSIFLFLAVSVVGAALLLLTGRLSI